MSWPKGLTKVEREMVALGQLDRVAVNPDVVGDWVNEASRHLRSAALLAEVDPRLAYSACHDAIRKVLTGLLAERGLRPKGGEGGHARVVEWGTVALGDDVERDVLDAIDLIRRQRHVAEYGELASQIIGSAEVTEAIRVANEVLAGAKRALKRQRPVARSAARQSRRRP